MLTLTAVLSLAVLLPTVLADEKLVLMNPPELITSVGVSQITEVPALFGFPSYRNTLIGQAILASPSDGCAALDKSNPLWSDLSLSLFAVMDRGNCTFVTKVRNAQNAGARAALIADNVDEWWGMPYMADDGTGSNVVIPSVLMDFTQAKAIKTWLATNPTLANSVSLSYNLPNPDNRVEWDLFSSSWDTLTVSFKEAMIPVVKALDKNQFFTPHYNVMSGTSVGCAQPSLPCGSQCLNNGLYCANDPDRDINSGLSGQDVLLEDIRQLCIWNWLNQTYGEGGKQYLLFQYFAVQNSICNSKSNPDLWRNGVCQNATMSSLGIDVNAVATCVATSNTTNGRNYWLDRMLQDQTRYGAVFWPAVYVNLRPYRGSLCTAPIKNVGCGVVDMICQGYDTDDIPTVCNTQPASCPFGVTQDCSLSCGTKVVDACGSCLQLTDERFNQSCADKSGEVCPLPKQLDACKVCGGDGSTCSGATLSTGAIVGIVFGALVVVGLVGVGVYFYMQYQSKKMREDIDSLLKQYLPLEGGMTSGSVQKNGRMVDTASEHDI